jgi:hypothetical protein
MGRGPVVVRSADAERAAGRRIACGRACGDAGVGRLAERGRAAAGAGVAAASGAVGKAGCCAEGGRREKIRLNTPTRRGVGVGAASPLCARDVPGSAPRTKRAASARMCSERERSDGNEPGIFGKRAESSITERIYNLRGKASANAARLCLAWCGQELDGRCFTCSTGAGQRRRRAAAKEPPQTVSMSVSPVTRLSCGGAGGSLPTRRR